MRRSRSTRSLRTSLLLAILLCLLPNAQGVLAGDLLIRRPFAILVNQPHLRFKYMYVAQENEITSPSMHTSNDSSRQQFNFELGTSGFLYHPALVTWSAAIEPRFGVQRNESSEKDATVLGYALSTSWLQHKPYSFGLSASRSTSDVTTNQNGTSTQVSTQNLATIQLGYFDFPIDGRIGSSTTEIEGYVGSRIDRDFRSISSRRKTTAGETRLDIEDSRNSRVSGTYESFVERLQARLRQTLQVGDDARLNTNLSYTESDFGRGVVTAKNVSTNLIYPLPFRFTTNWAANAASSSSSGKRYESTGLSGSLNHQLYENLSSTLTMSATENRGELGKLRNDTIGVSSNYRRRTPWGSVAFGLRQSARTLRDDRAPQVTDVLGEGYTFEGISTSVVLDNYNIDVASILITDLDGGIVYIEGFDYSIEQFEDLVVVRRNLLGNIEDDQAILVSYQYATAGPSKSRQNSAGYTASVTIGPLGLSYGTGRSDQEFLEGFARRVPKEGKTTTASASLDLRIASLTYRQARREIYANAYEKDDVTLRFRPISIGRATLTVHAQAYQDRIIEAQLERTGISFSAAYNRPVSRYGNMGISAAYSDNQGNATDQRNLLIDIRYNWRYGDWTGLLALSTSDVSNEFFLTDFSRRRLSFQMQRSFW